MKLTTIYWTALRNFPRPVPAGQPVPSLRCRWVRTGDPRLPVSCFWLPEKNEQQETALGDGPLELSRCMLSRCMLSRCMLSRCA
jgi:hypothetical protein